MVPKQPYERIAAEFCGFVASRYAVSCTFGQCCSGFGAALDGYISVDGRFDRHAGDNLYWQSTKSDGEIHSINFGHVKRPSDVDELEDFLSDIEAGRQPKPNGRDGLAVLRMVEAIYCGNGKRVTLG